MNELSDSDEIDGNEDVKQCSEYDVLYKALMVGEAGVGKTAFVRRYMNPFEGLPMNLLPTLGIDYVKIDKVIDGVRVRTLLWDTVGQERFRTITKNYFRGAKGILLLYDVTERSSFNMINHWVKSLRMFDLEYAEIYLVGNKIDLSPRQVDYEEGKQLAYSNGMKYVETSAKTCENIKETMEILISNMKDANHAELKGPLPAMQSEERVDVINLKDGEDKPTKKSKCCRVFSNAFESIRDRMPFILTKVIDFMSRTASDHLVNNQQEKGDDAKSVVGRLVRLNNELQTDKLLLPLTSQHGDEQIWNDFLQTVPTLDQRKVRWFNVKWITCECYMYRRINEALQLSTHHKQVDPFFEQKAAAFHSASKAVSSLAALLLKPQPACKENFDVFLEYSLWGNKCDLSIAPNADNQVGTCDERDLLKRHILCNHTDQVWNYIAQLRPKQGKVKITFILDNAGFELFCDVCLADYLLSSELCDVIEFHVKDLPWFVSDVTAVDFTWMIEQCENFQPSSDVRELGARWRSFVQDGRFCVVNDVYWTLPHDFTTMQELRSQLYDKLKQSDLLVFKGDLNYRKLIGDMQWDPTTSIAEASKPFLPAPWLTLRTIKCETVVNIPTGKSEQMYEIESDWMLKGNYAVISFCQ